MPIPETAPTTPVSMAEWQAAPKNPGHERDFEKYDYITGETIESIARRITQPGRTVTVYEITMLNWGTAVEGEVNYYLRTRNGCKPSLADTHYDLSSTDPNPWFWVPRIAPPAPIGKFRSPGKHDVGHVALDDEKNQHVNTLIVPPVYAITLELGDIDALFDPMDPRTDAAAPWNNLGVRQRLQYLGYLYTPLAHSQCIAHAQECWKYYKRVHDRKQGPRSNLTGAELLGILKQEIQNNIITRDLPKSGQVYQNSKLPARDQFAAIRIPGGYCTTKPRLTYWTRPAPVDADAEFDFGVVDNTRWEIEDKLWEKNALMGKIPLVATVYKLLPDGRRVPAEGVSVYFQLATPDPLPTSGSLRAVEPDIRNEIMDTSKADMSKEGRILAHRQSAWTDRAKRPNARAMNKGCNAAEWGQAWDMAHAAHADPNGASAYMAGQTAGKVKEAAEVILKFAPPYTIADRGPKAFLDKLLDDIRKDVEKKDAKDPQKRNCPAECQLPTGSSGATAAGVFGGKSGLAVEGETKSGKFCPGVFEMTKRDGFHTRRSDRHRDYGTLNVAEKVTPDGDFHKYAVKAKTNDKGIAGVVFMPSRCGGDSYRLRAYVGPETLQFPTLNADCTGEDAKGPVVETGTMTVWRNVRLHRWVRLSRPTPPVYSPTMTDLLTRPAALGVASRAVPGQQLYDTNYFNSPLSPLALATEDQDYLFPAPVATIAETKLQRTVALRFASFGENLRRAYCDLIIDTDGPEDIGDAELRDAINAGVTAAQLANACPINLDWDELLVSDNTSPYLLNWRHPMHYNEVIRRKGLNPVAYPDLLHENETHMNAFSLVVNNEITQALMNHLAGGGILPGLTIFQVPQGETWHWRTLAWAGACYTSGIGTARRSTVVFHTREYHDKFMCYSATANISHELGHVLGLAHQDPNPGGPVVMHEPGRRNDDFDNPIPPGHTSCVMSYDGCFGEFCGRCLLALRGWRTKSDKMTDGA